MCDGSGRKCHHLRVVCTEKEKIVSCYLWEPRFLSRTIRSGVLLNQSGSFGMGTPAHDGNVLAYSMHVADDACGGLGRDTGMNVVTHTPDQSPSYRPRRDSTNSAGSGSAPSVAAQSQNMMFPVQQSTPLHQMHDSHTFLPIGSPQNFPQNTSSTVNSLTVEGFRGGGNVGTLAASMGTVTRGHNTELSSPAPTSEHGSVQFPGLQRYGHLYCL